MMTILNFRRKKPKAHVVDGKLVLSLPRAENPVVWQMDLAATKTSALEVVTQEDVSTLTLKTPKGEVVTIASFQDPDDALAGLLVTSKALKVAHGKIAVQPANDSAVPFAQPGTFLKTTAKVIGALLVLFFLYSLVLALLGGGGLAPADYAPAVNPQTEGVPMSADDFLRGQ